MRSIKIFIEKCEQSIDVEIKENLNKCADDWGTSYINIGYRKAMERGLDFLKIAWKEWKENKKKVEEDKKQTEGKIYKCTYESYIAYVLKSIEYELHKSGIKLLSEPKMATFYTGYKSGLKLIQKLIIINCKDLHKERVSEAVESGNYQALLEEIER